MGRFDKWARNGAIFTATTPRAPAPARVAVPAAAPSSVPVALHTPAPAPPPPPPARGVRLVAVHRPAQVVHPQQVTPAPTTAAPAPATCILVRPGASDRYAELLNATPALDVPDLSGGVDAMRLAGRPEHAVMQKWTETARYYNGVTDQTAAGQVDGVVAGRHRDSLGSIREAKVAAIHRGQNHLD